MLILQVLRPKSPAVVHVYYSESEAGGHLGSVYPGGSFMGYTFDELARLGSGKHELKALDPYDFSSEGEEPKYDTEWEEMFARFEFSLFGYQVGACTAGEVLSYASRVIKAQNEGQA